MGLNYDDCGSTVIGVFEVVAKGVVGPTGAFSITSQRESCMRKTVSGLN